MRLLYVEVSEVPAGGPAVGDSLLGHHEGAGHVQLLQGLAHSRPAPGCLAPLLSMESDGTGKVVFTESSAQHPVHTAVRHLVTPELESVESVASLANLPEDRVVSSAANLQDCQPG